MSAFIEVRGLHKSFGSKQALRGIDLTVNEHEVLVIIGRSGCGKSVLLKHIIGLLKPDQGEVLISGVNVSRCPDIELNELRMRCGYLFQEAALFDSMTVEDNVSFALRRFSKKSKAEIHRLVKEKLNLVGLNNIQHLRPSSLSGGMRRRVGLARALAMDPEVILYDEPTTGLDPIMSDAVDHLIVDLQSKLKKTSIVVTHDMRSAYKIGDRIAMLYQGVVVAMGTPKEIQQSQDPIVQQFITGSSQGPISILDES